MFSSQRTSPGQGTDGNQSSTYHFTHLISERNIHRPVSGPLNFKPCSCLPSTYFWCCVLYPNPVPDHQPWHWVSCWHGLVSARRIPRVRTLEYLAGSQFNAETTVNPIYVSLNDKQNADPAQIPLSYSPKMPITILVPPSMGGFYFFLKKGGTRVERDLCPNQLLLNIFSNFQKYMAMWTRCYNPTRALKRPLK